MKFKKGHKINLGRKQSKETIEKRKLKLPRGKDNIKWKGDMVGEGGLHSWVRRYKPKPKVCEKCKQKHPYDLANISGNYRRDVNDFEWLCRKCHQLSDGRLDRLHQFNKDYPKLLLRDSKGRFMKK